MSTQQTQRPGLSRFSRVVTVALPLICLAVPSVWLMTTVPPLWRDVDAYIQVSAPPGPSTILLHGPLYCQLARVPLWIGYLTTGGSMGLADFMKHPRLTDAGVALLLFLQHAGLWLTAFYLISALSSSLLVRTALAIFFASHPLFYAYAHCVGSETLSLILILLLVGVGLRMVAAYPALKVRWWLLAGLLLCCCILTRHINAVRDRATSNDLYPARAWPTVARLAAAVGAGGDSAAISGCAAGARLRLLDRGRHPRPPPGERIHPPALPQGSHSSAIGSRLHIFVAD